MATARTPFASADSKVGGDPHDYDHDDGAGAARSPWRPHPWLTALAVYGVLKLAGLAVFLYLVDSAGDFRDKAARYGGGSHAWDVLTSWDGWWYRQIAEHGYDPRLIPAAGGSGHWSIEQNSAAFFPLYPGLIRLVSEITGLGSFGAGLTVSIAASFLAAAGIHAVTVRLAGHRTGVYAAGLWAVWPGSGAEWTVYSDSLFIALAAWTCHAVLTRRWIPAGFLCLTAGLSRPSSVTLIAAVVLAGLVAAWHREDGVKRPLAAAALAPLGFLGYVAWVGAEAGNPRAFFLLESDAWAHYIDYGSQTVHAVHAVMVGHTDYDFANPTEDLVGTGAILLSVIALVALVSRRPPSILTAFAVLTVALTLGSHQFFGNVSRYLLAAFPLVIPAAAALSGLKRPAGVTILTVLALASGSYAGYMLYVLGIP